MSIHDPTEAADARDAARSWLLAAQRPEIALELDAVYDWLAVQVESRGPVCNQSGRCCRFEEYGHRLYTTGLEAACTLVRLAQPLAPEDVQAALQRGGCPFQINKLCSVHAIRPLGCRVYYCDPSAQSWQEDLCERALAQVRRIHDRYGIEYHYGEWRAMLTMLATAQRG